MKDYRMVYDSGSKSLKCAIADDIGNIIALESWEKEVIRSEDGFYREWNSKNFWDKVIELSKYTIKSAKIRPQDIKYITASSIRPSCVFTDEDNNAIYIGSSFELRGIDYAEEIEESFQELAGKSLYESTGHFPSLLMNPARYKYFQEEREKDDRIERIVQYLPMDSWILVKLGGEIHTNIVSAGESGFFDLETKFWHPIWDDILDLPEFFFPWPVLPGEIIGTVSEKYQKELGLNSETNLVAGMSDTQAALLGCGCVEEGSIGAVLGSTTPVQAITNQLIIDPSEKTWSGLFACKHLCNHYYLETNTGLTGQILKWAANLFYSDEELTLEKRYQRLDQAFKRYDQYEMEATVEQIRESSVYALLGPVPLSPSQTGTTPGLFQFQSPGGVEETIHNKDAFIAAVFDNIQFAITQNIEIAVKLSNISEPSYAIMGGIARNSILTQRFSDLLQKSIITSNNYEATIQGLLVLCQIASGNIRSIEDLKSQNQNLKTVDPREPMKQKLNIRYQTWQKMFKEFNS